jgi:hypothetical protein
MGASARHPQSRRVAREPLVPPATTGVRLDHSFGLKWLPLPGKGYEFAVPHGSPRL